MDIEEKCELSFILQICASWTQARRLLKPLEHCKFGAGSVLSPCCVAWEPCLLFTAETTSSRGNSSGRLWNLGSGPIRLLVGGRRWWKCALEKHRWVCEPATLCLTLDGLRECISQCGPGTSSISNSLGTCEKWTFSWGGWPQTDSIRNSGGGASTLGFRRPSRWFWAHWNLRTPCVRCS